MYVIIQIQVERRIVYTCITGFRNRGRNATVLLDHPYENYSYANYYSWIIRNGISFSTLRTVNPTNKVDI